MEVTVKKTDSTDVAEQIKPVYNTCCSRKNNLFPEFKLQFQIFFASRKFSSQGKKDKKKKDASCEGIQENTSLSNIYWRFY